MKQPDSRSGVLATAVRALFFRATRDELDQLSVHHLGVGLVFTWLVGMGRYWDNPRAEVLQRIGLGSVVYIFVLSLALWFVFKPFVRERWTYMRVVTFVSLTAPPAFIYAIPVEMFMDMAGAQTANMWMLLVVAVWRVSLWLFSLRRRPSLAWGPAVIGTLLPVILLIVCLTILNLEKAVFDVMGGIRTTQTSADQSYAVLFLITMLSQLAILPVLGFYIYYVYKSKTAGGVANSADTAE